MAFLCTTFSSSCASSAQHMNQNQIFISRSTFPSQPRRSCLIGDQMELDSSFSTKFMPQLKDLETLQMRGPQSECRTRPVREVGARLVGNIRRIGNGPFLPSLERWTMKGETGLGSGPKGFRIATLQESRGVVKIDSCVGGNSACESHPGAPNFSGRTEAVGGRMSRRKNVEALSSSYGAESLSGDDHSNALSHQEEVEEPVETTSTQQSPLPSKYKGSLKVVGVLTSLLGVGTLAALGLTLNSGGPSALLSVVSKSGFPAAFALIFVSEIGDKTFFIAALLAMRHSKWLVLLGASAALSVMTVISVIIGKLCQKVPAQLQTTLPLGEYAAVALLVWFGFRSIKAAWDIPSASAGDRHQSEEVGELAEAEKFLKRVDDKNSVRTSLDVLGEAFTLIFLAEWGDRSMLATIALGAAQSPWGVASGAIAGHVLATLLAVMGGALLARYLSEKLIGYFGGVLFLAFAAATLTGVF